MLRTQWQAASLLIGAVACGDPGAGGGDLDAMARAPDGGTDGGSGSSSPRGGPDAGSACEADEACDDGSPCNGPERCVRGRCASSRPLSDGTICEQDGIPNTYDVCMAGHCVLGRCGDGHVDERAGETCDDANAVGGDGCTECRFDCSADADCDDGRACNGQEMCDLRIRMCAGGVPPPDGTSCRAGAGSCLAEVCLLSECADDLDCTDDNPCNGPELCTADGCALGVALDCDDGDPCTADHCVEDLGCGHDPIDRDGDGHAPAALGACGDDCNDGRRDIHPGAVELCDGADNDCDGRIDEGSAPRFYADCDGDGHAAEGALSIVSCRVPSGALTGCPGGGMWTTLAPADAADCNDGNALVHPSQRTFQSDAIPGAPEGRDYDYDCDGIETELFPVEVGVCASMRDVCETTAGWLGQRAECGESGLMLARCRAFLAPSGLIECVGIPETTLRTQRCL